MEFIFAAKPIWGGILHPSPIGPGKGCAPWGWPKSQSKGNVSKTSKGILAPDFGLDLVLDLDLGLGLDLGVGEPET